MDTRKRPKKQNDLRIYSWNILTLYKSGALRQLENVARTYKADLIALQEVRWNGDGVMQKKDFDLYYSCHKKDHKLGTGFLVGKRLKTRVLDFAAINPRMCKLRIKSRFFNITIINVHAPTEDKDDDRKDEFYEILERTYNSCPKHDIKIIIGDANAKVGREEIYRKHIGKHSLHAECNNNGTRLVNFAASKNMIIGSTMFERKDIHKATWTNPSKTYQNQIDHVLIDARHISNLMNVRSYKGANIDSDHFLLGATLRARISRANNSRSAKRIKFNLDALKDADTSKLFSEQAEAKLSEISGNSEDVQEVWTNLKVSIKYAAEKVLGEKPKPQRNGWFDAECQEATDQKNKAYLNLQQGKITRTKTEKYKDLRRAEKRLHKKKKKSFLKKQFEELEQLRFGNDTKKFYSQVNADRKGFIPQTNLCRGVNGQLITDTPGILNRWVEHFQLLLNPNPQPEQTTVLANDVVNGDPVDEPTIFEVERAIAKLKNGKSPGSDDIPAELIKHGGEVIVDVIHGLCLNIWKNETMPEEWNTGLICPIHKKGDKMNCNNYRGITLLNTGYKVLSNVLFERLLPWTEKAVGDYQAGFRAGRSTSDQIFVLRQLLQKLLEVNVYTFHVFIDFKAAYDTVLRPKLYEAMHELGIPEKLVNLTKMTMQRVNCQIKIRDDTSEPFQAMNGLRQGDALSCLLFNIALEKSIRDSKVNTSGTLFNKSVQVLAYADDIDVAARNLAELTESVLNILKAAKNMGLEVNEDKTKVMVCYPEKSRDPDLGQNLMIGDHNFEVVNSFKYLGSTVNQRNLTSSEIQARILSANRCYFGLRRHLTNSLISRPTKSIIYRTLIKPVLTYACETWSLTKAEEQTLGVFERKILRTIYGGVNDNGVWRRRYNNELYQLYGHPDVVTDIKFHRLRYAGHIARAPETFPPKMVLSSEPTGGRRPGRPRKRWKDCVNDDARRFDLAGWEHRAQDRDEWRQSLKEAKARTGLSRQ